MVLHLARQGSVLHGSAPKGYKVKLALWKVPAPGEGCPLPSEHRRRLCSWVPGRWATQGAGQLSLPGWLSLPSLHCNHHPLMSCQPSVTALSLCCCSFIPTFTAPVHQAPECIVPVKQEPRASGSSREVPTGGSSREGTRTAVATVTARRLQPSVLLSGYEVPQEALQGAGDQPLSRLERVAR